MGAVQRINGIVRRIPPLALYLLAPVPAAVWFYQAAFTNRLGPEPINALERLYGEFALQILVAVLAITPLRTHLKIDLVRLRRALGVIGFSYVALHLSVWLFLDVAALDRIVADIFKRPYVTIGMAAFLVLAPLAATSNNLSVRRLGPIRWRRLHRLTYAAVVLGGVHYVMIVKGFQFEPLIYLAVILALLGLRALPRRGRPARAAGARPPAAESGAAPARQKKPVS